jgi:ketosteroid isomerase-like protein
VLAQWQQARSEMDAADFFARYGTPRTLLTESDNAANQRSGRPAADESVWLVRPEVKLGVTHLSLLQSQHPQPSMVATFEETLNGQPTGVMRRQYWHQPGGQWKLLQDTVLSGTPSAQLKRAVPTVALASASSSRSEAATAASAPQKASPSAPTTTSRQNASTPSVNSDEEAVKQAVHAWANAWASKNMAAYLAAYDAQFETPKGQNRKAWEQERKDRIVYKTRIEVQLSRMAIRMQGNQATVRFVQNYRADQLNVSSRKTLTMVRKGKHWLIAQEQVGR